MLQLQSRLHQQKHTLADLCCRFEQHSKLCCRALIQCLRRMGPAHCYATSMSAPAVEQVIASMDLLQGKDGTDRGLRKIQQLHDNANYFRQKLIAMGCSVLGSNDSPVMVRAHLHSNSHRQHFLQHIDHHMYCCHVLSGWCFQWASVFACLSNQACPLGAVCCLIVRSNVLLWCSQPSHLMMSYTFLCLCSPSCCSTRARYLRHHDCC